MRLILLFFLFSCALDLAAQGADPLSGQYNARVQEDHLTLSLEKSSGNTYSGTMTDSHQTYAVQLHRSGTQVTGTATEASLGIHFTVTGEIQGTQLPLRFTLDFMGETTTMDIAFSKNGTQESSNSTATPSATTDIVFPAGSSHPRELAGTWIKEELYQSGYGDQSMSAGFSQSMTFLPDGRMAEAGSSAYMSGSDYSGQSSGQEQGVIPGLAWYAVGNQLYLQVTEAGRTQNIHLGKYYVENNNMLITGTNGEKLLLTRR